jgi:phospholipase/carboxylesterase
MNQPTHTHHFIAGTDPAKPPLVLLHGSGGNEHDLLPLAEELAPGSPVLGVRGTVAIDGGFAFFHRLPDRSIDKTDISERTPVLAEFIRDTTTTHGLTMAPIAIGFSNGAIMAAALLLTRPWAARGCDPVQTSLTVPGRPACLFGWRVSADHRRGEGQAPTPPRP